MKFPRYARISRGQLDATPFAGVLFCLLIFILLGSVVYTPGVRIELPVSSARLPGIDGPSISVGIDPTGQYYFENQVIFETNLLARLQEEVTRQGTNVTLVVQADKNVTLEQLNHLRDIAATAGVGQLFQQVMPGVFSGVKTLSQP